MVRPRTRTRSRTRAAAGFTLLEMLIVVAIVGITAALAAPAIAGAMMERRNNEAALELVRIVRRARSSAVASGRAHVLRFDAPTAAGRYRVYEGTSSGCNSGGNDWATRIGSSCDPTSGCVDYMDLSQTRWDLGSNEIRSSMEDVGGFLDLCFERRGTMLWRTSAGDRFSAFNTGAVDGGFVAVFTRYEGGTATGVQRRTVIPFGGDARLLQ